MLTRFITLLVLFAVLAVLAKDKLEARSYILKSEQVSIRGRITGVIDGDTINVLILSKHQIRVRVAFIDAPEKGQAFGQRAKQAMSDLVFGKDVELRPHTIDRYGLLVARVLVDNRDAGLELLKQGLCWVFEHYGDEAPAEYRNAQASAQSEKLGLWQDPAPVPPWQWREEERAKPQLQSSWFAGRFMN
jgi:endonuclease YncB( thermonuclease family)